MLDNTSTSVQYLTIYDFMICDIWAISIQGSIPIVHISLRDKKYSEEQTSTCTIRFVFTYKDGYIWKFWLKVIIDIIDF